MKSSELMLNNYLQYDGRYVKVQPSDLLAIYQIEIAIKAGVNRSMDYEPIPLSPEIMAKIEGCEELHKSIYTQRWEIEQNGVHVVVSQNIPANTWVVNNIAIAKPELHLLQNAIYCITGNPLQITL